MDLVKLLETVVNDESVDTMSESIIDEHYHKVRELQRCLNTLPEDLKYNLNDRICTEIDGGIEFTAIVEHDIDKIIETLEGYEVDERFDISITHIERELEITITQSFDGREDEVLYGD